MLMKTTTLIFAIVFCIFALVSSYLYFALHSFHFAFFAVGSYLISYFMFKDAKEEPTV